jgi:cell division septation protein DedD
MTMPAANSPAPAAATPAAAPAPKPVAATPAPATPAAKPAPVAATETPAAPQKVASIQPTAPAAAAPAEASVGGFSVQLGVRGSEKDAQVAFGQFQKKYQELAGQPALIRKAEINGNTVFRVRAGPMSRDDASQICSAVQGQGGQCFVAKN